MRNKLFQLVFMMLLINLVGCTSKEKNEENATENDFYLSFTTDGQQYKAKSYVIGEQATYPACDAFVETDQGIKHFAANAIFDAQQGLTAGFSIIDYHGVGTYTCGNNINNISNMYIKKNGVSFTASQYFGGQGTLTVTDEHMYKESGITKYVITGTFSFTGIANDNTSPAKTVTNGKFKLNAKILSF